MKFPRLVVFVVAMSGAATLGLAQTPVPTATPGEAAPAPEAKPRPKPTILSREEVLRAIAMFRQDPLRAREDGIGPAILTFAEASTEVEVGVGSKVLPWMEGDRADSQYKTMLMFAYVAGNVESQLESHVKRNDPMAGATLVIDTYLKLKKSGIALNFPSVEQWIVLQKQGKLRKELTGR